MLDAYHEFGLLDRQSGSLTAIVTVLGGGLQQETERTT
jgi:hypothetical protein